MRLEFKQKMIIQCCYVLDSSNGKIPFAHSSSHVHSDKYSTNSLSIYSLYYIHSLDMM